VRRIAKKGRAGGEKKVTKTKRAEEGKRKTAVGATTGYYLEGLKVREDINR